MTLIQSPDPASKWKEKPNSTELPSAYHMYTGLHANLMQAYANNSKTNHNTTAYGLLHYATLYTSNFLQSTLAWEKLTHAGFPPRDRALSLHSVQRHLLQCQRAHRGAEQLVSPHQCSQDSAPLMLMPCSSCFLSGSWLPPQQAVLPLRKWLHFW